MSDTPGDDRPTFGPDDRPLGITDVELAVFEGEAVLFDVEASMVHLLDAVAGATWVCCDGETTVTQIVDELAETFGITTDDERETLTSSIHDALGRFVDEGLLQGFPRPQRIIGKPVPQHADDGTEIVVAPPDI